MAIPRAPWYGKLQRVLAPTETVSTVLLIIIIVITIIILVKGHAAEKAAWLIYLVSP